MKLDDAIRKQSPQNREYELKLKIESRKHVVHDQRVNGTWRNYESEVVYLVPEQSTQTTLFFSAWLPGLAYDESRRDDEGNPSIVRHEVAIEVAHPLFATIRGAVCRANKNFERHHIMVMTESCYEALKTLEGKHIVGKVLGEMEMEKALG